jgi:hypothetical protein
MQHSTKDAPGQCETGHPMYLYLKKKNTNKRLRKMAFNAHAKSAERCITRHKRCPMAHREKTKQKSENESWVRSDIPSFCGRHYAAREKIDLVRAIAGLEKNEKEITDQKILLPIYPTALNLRTHPCDTEAHQRRTGPVQKKKQRIETSQLDHEDFMNPRCSTSRCVWAHCLSVPLREKVRKMRKQKEKNKKKEQPSLFPLPSSLIPSSICICQPFGHHGGVLSAAHCRRGAATASSSRYRGQDESILSAVPHTEIL